MSLTWSRQHHSINFTHHPKPWDFVYSLHETSTCLCQPRDSNERKGFSISFLFSSRDVISMLISRLEMQVDIDHASPNKTNKNGDNGTLTAAIAAY